MRPIPHPTDDEDEDETADAADRPSHDEVMAGEEKWLDIQEF